MKKPLIIDFKANTQNCDYSWKMCCKCYSSDNLRFIKLAINTYIDMKIKEMEENNERELVSR